jgi:hypothetical protein
MGPEGAHDHTKGRRVATGWIGGAVIAVLGIATVVISVQDDKPAVAAPLSAASVEAAATIPPSTTTIPRSTTTALPPGVTLAPGETLPVEILPPGPPERPTGLVAGVFYDTLVGVGADPGVARCAADDLIATTSEPDLLALGIASSPRPDAVNALLDASAKNCGVTQAQLDAAAAAAAGG